MQINRDSAADMIYFTLGFVLLCGLLLLFSDCLRYIREMLAMRHRLRPAQRSSMEELKLIGYLRVLSSSVLGRETDGSLVLSMLIALFFCVFIPCLRSFTAPMAVFLGLLAALVPVMVMNLKLDEEQTRSSREGISLVSEIFRQYRIHGRNIYEALEHCLENTESYPLCGKHVYRLLLRLRSAASPYEIRSCTGEFAFALGTVWGRMLASCIRVSAEKGTDISAGLTDITEQLRQADKRVQERSRLNSEAERMTVFLVPLLYAGTMFISVKYLGLGFSELIRNQFTEAEGFLFFLVSAFLFVFNMMLLKIVSSAKTDY